MANKSTKAGQLSPESQFNNHHIQQPVSRTVSLFATLEGLQQGQERIERALEEIQAGQLAQAKRASNCRPSFLERLVGGAILSEIVSMVKDWFN